jgi:hypothetical protein
MQTTRDMDPLDRAGARISPRAVSRDPRRARTALRKAIALGIGFLVLVGMVGLAGWTAQPGLRAEAAPGDTTTPTPAGGSREGPQRKTTLKVPFTSYQWWLLSWQTNQAVCQLWIEHDGLPKPYEVSSYCDAAAYSLYNSTTACPQAVSGGDTHACHGVYMHFVGSADYTRDVEVELPPPSVGVTVSDCDLAPPDNRCDHLPDLVLTGEEPLPNETIIAIHGTLGGEPFNCQGPTCTIPIPATGPQGIPVEFWADSSFGDSSQHFTAQVRAMPYGDFMSPEGQSSDQQVWYVDVLSTQWRGAPLASCSDVWESFPDPSGPPAWLTTPDRVTDLYTNEPLYFLAGVLIENGEVDASDCKDGGLSSPGVASGCGLQVAQEKLVTWQNQFDTEILQVAKNTGVPAQLMKNIFYRESQFWPGIYQSFKEAGLGQLTANGAETTLLWNPDFFNQFCPLVFQKDICNMGWPKLSPEHQQLLEGALVNKVNAACPNCPAGIDLTRARFSINVFAESLRANCEQAGQTVYNATHQPAGSVARYQDLWMFTLINYNAGPGCLAYAVNQAVNANEPLDWPHVANHLTDPCRGALSYVESVAGVLSPNAALTATAQAPTQPTPVVLPTHAHTSTNAFGSPTPSQTTPQPTQLTTATPTRTGGPSPTPTQAGYPGPGATQPAYPPYPGAGTPEPTYNPYP